MLTARARAVREYHLSRRRTGRDTAGNVWVLPQGSTLAMVAMVATNRESHTVGVEWSGRRVKNESLYLGEAGSVTRDT